MERSVRQVTDERGHTLRVTWRPSTGMTVVSVWHDDECVGTVRLDADGMRSVASALSGALSRTSGSS